ncbi:hypothetical protein EUV02_04580 [Polymorphobacter arshaanensis]|uniref:Uncharacterized protein n=1 Tax=Glacieibacterium arshaanense TaxID=2511025 RepID=A0A4Y9ES49_9SPHN|nr:hypothetical protein EUV02_04580 [Polymorphobacter arshaanensis]
MTGSGPEAVRPVLVDRTGIAAIGIRQNGIPAIDPIPVNYEPTFDARIRPLARRPIFGRKGADCGSAD